jgi:tRNA-splicing ligase RtcB
MTGMSEIPITVRGDVDPRAVEQLRRCAQAGDAVAGALCADGHVGYSQPIGGVVAYPDHISPSGVGYDIACGNKAVRTDLQVEDVRPDLPRLMDEIFDRVSFGVGRRNNEPVDHPVLDRIREADFAGQRELHGLAAKQLGTVGAGNHYVDVFAGDDGLVWVGVHFGSRGFGHRTASGFLSLAAGGRFDQPGRDGEMDSPPVLLHVDSDLGQGYLAAMGLAGEYAYAGRDVVTAKVLEILGGRETYAVHNHHNFAGASATSGRTPGSSARAARRRSRVRRGSWARRWASRPWSCAARRPRAARGSAVDRARRGAGHVAHAGRGADPQPGECTVRDCDSGCRGRSSSRRARKPGSASATLHGLSAPPRGTMVKRRGRVTEGLIDFGSVRTELSRRASSCAAAPRTRRPAPTSAWTRSWPPMATRWRSCTG